VLFQMKYSRPNTMVRLDQSNVFVLSHRNNVRIILLTRRRARWHEQFEKHCVTTNISIHKLSRVHQTCSGGFRHAYFRVCYWVKYVCFFGAVFNHAAECNFVRFIVPLGFYVVFFPPWVILLFKVWTGFSFLSSIPPPLIRTMLLFLLLRKVSLSTWSTMVMYNGYSPYIFCERVGRRVSYF